MHTHEIPSDQWKPFLDSFTRLHRGERVDLEMIGGGEQPRSEFCNRPLLGIVALQDLGYGSAIEVMAGDQSSAESYTIRQPAQVSITERDDGYPVALQISADDGRVTALRFEPPHRSDRPPEDYLG